LFVLTRGLVMGTSVNMRSTSKTRVQKRMEKKQAILLLVLVVAIAVASFALGVIVGRPSVESTVVQQVVEPRRIVVPDTVVAQPGDQIAEESPEEEKLTFYENLSKEDPAPIGSGINLPPETEKPVVVAVAAAPGQGTPEAAPATEAVAVVASPKKTVELARPAPTPLSSSVPTSVGEKLPGATRGGAWVVQVFSSKSAADAGTLRDKLSAKGYPAYIAEADLGAKGIWYRVHFGPYVDRNTAQQAQAYAEKNDKLKGFTKRR